jgi:UDPglucose 6-dehydrogenase
MERYVLPPEDCSARSKNLEKVCVIGLWHLGCVYSACLAGFGYSVTGVDGNTERVKNLNKGIPPVFEPELEELIINNIESGHLTYTTDMENAVCNCPYIIIAFDTPVDDNDEVDLSPITNTCKRIAPYLNNGCVLIISSQVPVGTCEKIKAMIMKENPSLDFDIACCPENLRLGKAIAYFKNPDRIIIGADSDDTLYKTEKFFSVVPAPAIKMGLKSAEMTKHALNAFLATSISFSSEIANICDEVGADALKVALALRSESRIGHGIPLLPGLGFAGGTLARDLKILKKSGSENNYETPLIDSVLTVNKRQNGIVIRKLEKVFGSLAGLNIGILGITYKPGTSTLRRSSSLEIIAELVKKGAKVKAFDPKADMDEVKQHVVFDFCDDAYAVAQNSDALILITEWLEFKLLDYERIKKIMKKPVLIDARNMLDMEQMKILGFIYLGIGRGE